jgi:hypothetical protein
VRVRSGSWFAVISRCGIRLAARLQALDDREEEIRVYASRLIRAEIGKRGERQRSTLGFQIMEEGQSALQAVETHTDTAQEERRQPRAHRFYRRLGR